MNNVLFYFENPGKYISLIWYWLSAQFNILTGWWILISSLLCCDSYLPTRQPDFERLQFNRMTEANFSVGSDHQNHSFWGDLKVLFNRERGALSDWTIMKVGQAHNWLKWVDNFHYKSPMKILVEKMFGAEDRERGRTYVLSQYLIFVTILYTVNLSMGQDSLIRR